MSHNENEYEAIMRACEYARDSAEGHPEKTFEIISDSQLAIRQLRHEYKIRPESVGLRWRAEEIWAFVKENKLPIEFKWVCREENKAGAYI
jgi:ribonuclease HI